MRRRDGIRHDCTKKEENYLAHSHTQPQILDLHSFQAQYHFSPRVFPFFSDLRDFACVENVSFYEGIYAWNANVNTEIKIVLL